MFYYFFALVCTGVRIHKDVQSLRYGAGCNTVMNLAHNIFSQFRTEICLHMGSYGMSDFPNSWPPVCIPWRWSTFLIPHTNIHFYVVPPLFTITPNYFLDVCFRLDLYSVRPLSSSCNVWSFAFGRVQWRSGLAVGLRFARRGRMPVIQLICRRMDPPIYH